MIDIVKHAFTTNKLPGGGSFSIIPELTEKKQLTCKVYPNPAESMVNVVFDNPLKEQATIRLFNDQGKMIKSQILGSGSIETLFDLSDVSEGIYLMVIQSSQQMTTKKLTVIRH